MNSFIWKYCITYIVIFISTFEFQYTVIPNIYLFVNPFFENLVYWSGITFFNQTDGFITAISSDSLGLFIHVFNLFFISGLVASFWQLTIKSSSSSLRYWTKEIITYYLSLQLLLYGFNKVFKAQFYQPEPNLLFTNLGDLTPDILYWSAIGSSWSFSFFLGIIELIVAVFLLFPKTRLVGILAGIGVMIHVVFINFSFDISVKVYSLFLLFLFVILFIPYAKYLYSALVLQRFQTSREKDFISLFTSKPKLRVIIKTTLILLFLIESLTPYVSAKNFNDDLAVRPIYHGAYKIETTSESKNEMQWKQIFVHRGGYLITKNGLDKMQDYRLKVDTINHTFNLVRYDIDRSYLLDYELSNGKLVRLKGFIESTMIDITLDQIDPSTIPLLNSEFHWTTAH